MAKPYQTGTHRFNRALIKVTIGNKTFDFYTHKRNEKNYLIIESHEPISHTSFYKHAYPVILGYGFITGNLPFGQGYYLSSDTRNFETVKNLIYHTLQSSIYSSYQIIHANSHAFDISRKKADYYYNRLKEVDVQIFSNICSGIHMRGELLRSIV